MERSNLSFVKLSGVSIFQQLQYEEALLRSDSGNWCLINSQAPSAIVLGISSKEDQHLHSLNHDIPIIRRFTGGGSVVIDENTLFVTFICNSQLVGVEPFPQQVLNWSENFYKKVFNHEKFRLLENDFVMDHLKCGGNAQYMQKNRWLLHTSFLWDYNEKHMQHLRLPPKMPKYRSERSHENFLCRLRDFFPCQQTLEERLINHLHQHFIVSKSNEKDLKDVTKKEHRKSTYLIKNC